MDQDTYVKLFNHFNPESTQRSKVRTSQQKIISERYSTLATKQTMAIERKTLHRTPEDLIKQ